MLSSLRTLRCPPRAGLAAGWVLLGLVAAGPACAALSDTFTPFIGVSYGYDDNLFRLPDSEAVVSDTIKSTVAGLAFERPLGRQRFSGSAKVSKVGFTRYDSLDYNGKDANLTWLWELGNHLQGQVGATYTETLTSFSDFRSTERNIRSARGQFAEANWRFHPSFRLHSRYSSDKYDYSLSSQSYLDRQEDRGELGVDYLAPSGSSVGLQLRRTKGEYPHPLSIGGLTDNENFTQNEVQLKVGWLFSGITQLQFLGGRVRRSHDAYSGRDTSGTNGRLDVTWSPRAALKLAGAAWREFQPFEGSSYATYNLSKGASVSATWEISSKLQAQASVRSNRREIAGVVLLGTELVGRDRTRNSTLGLNYAPLRNVQLGLSVFDERRSGASIFATPYRAKGATLNANVQF